MTGSWTRTNHLAAGGDGAAADVVENPIWRSQGEVNRLSEISRMRAPAVALSAKCRAEHWFEHRQAYAHEILDLEHGIGGRWGPHKPAGRAPPPQCPQNGT